MIKLILRFAIVSCLSGLLNDVSAQTALDEDLLLQEISATGSATIAESSVTLRQAGDANQAYIQQVNVASANLVEISQTGFGNSVDLLQQGSNFGIALRQEGNENEYVGEVEGLNARMEISQEGDFNSIHQAFGITDANLTIIQEGEGHQLIQTRDVRNAGGMRITQTGNAATIIIR